MSNRYNRDSLRLDWWFKLYLYRLTMFILGLLIFSFGISLAIKMDYLGLHPWDVLNVGLFDIFGLSIGSWSILIGLVLIFVALVLDRTYVKVGTFLNAFLIGILVDFYLWTDLLPDPANLPFDMFIMVIGIVIMGVGGGLYNAAGLGAGPRDGFMLSISDKTGYSIGRVRISVELVALVIGLFIGGPVFIFTFIFTFIQSPIFQYSYLKFSRIVDQRKEALNN